MERDPYSWGLRVGSVAGIPVRIHWSLLLLWAYDLNKHLSSPQGRPTVGLWAAAVGLSFLTIFLHEMGHAIASRSVGGDTSEILLWPLGGLAFATAPNIWRSQLIVAAGGPLVTALIFGSSRLVFWLVRGWYPDAAWSDVVYTGESILVDWQLTLLIFNLIPLYPLDGGRIFHALLWGFFRRGGGHVPGAYGRATLLTVYVSRATVVAGIAYSIATRSSFFSILIFFWAWSGTEALRRRLAQGAEEDYSFGYDFSRGYVSLEGRPPRPARPRRRGLLEWIRGGRRRASPGRAAVAGEEEGQRLDELLVKISREGIASLNDEERSFLEEASRRRRA